MWILTLLLAVLNPTPADTAQVNAWIREAATRMDTEPDSSLRLAQDALRLATELRFPDGQGSALMHLGIAEHLTGHGDGTARLHEALARFKSTGNRTHYAWALLNLANFHVDKGDYVGAAEHLQEALSLFEATALQTGISAASLNLAEIRMNLGQLDEAKALTRRALESYESMAHERGMSLALNRLGSLLIQKGEPLAAVAALDRSLALAESRKDDRQVASVLQQLATANESLGDLEAALAQYRRSLEIRLRIEDRIDLLGSQLGIASVLHRMGRSWEALSYARTAYDGSTDAGIPKSTADAAWLLYRIHKTLGDLPASLRYIETYESIRSDLFTAEKAAAIANLEALADVRRKAEQIESLTAQQTLERVILALVVAILAVSVLFMYLAINSRKRAQDLAAQLERVGRQKDQVLSILSHDLRGPMVSLSSLVDLIDLEMLSADDWAQLKPSLMRQFQGTNETLQDLLVWAKGQFEGENPFVQVQSLREAVTVGEELLDLVAKQKGVTIVNDVDRNAMVRCERSHLLTIIRNLVTNAVKFSHPGQTVTIQDGITEGMRILTVRDEGVGMSAELRDSLFEQTGTTRSGTAGETGSGLGLFFVRDLVHRNGGRIQVESTPGKGSTFSVLLPVA